MNENDWWTWSHASCSLSRRSHHHMLHTIHVHCFSARISCDGNAPETVTPRSPQLESVGFIITIHIAIALDPIRSGKIETLRRLNEKITTPNWLTNSNTQKEEHQIQVVFYSSLRTLPIYPISSDQQKNLKAEILWKNTNKNNKTDRFALGKQNFSIIQPTWSKAKLPTLQGDIWSFQVGHKKNQKKQMQLLHVYNDSLYTV